MPSSIAHEWRLLCGAVGTSLECSRSTGLVADPALPADAGGVNQTESRKGNAHEADEYDHGAAAAGGGVRLLARPQPAPDFMAHLDEVRETGPGRSHWRASAPFGQTVEWEAETTLDEPGRRIAWRSVGDADVQNSGEVLFVPAPGDRGTEVHVNLSYEVPGGTVGQAVAKYFGEEPHQQLDDDLRRFKQIVEIGEVMRSDGAPGGKQARQEFPQHPAQPLSEEELGGGAVMKAICWMGRNEVEVQDVPDPRILNARDAIVRVTSTAICGSDLHLLDGYVPTMQKGDVMGHEPMGEVVEVGPGVDATKLRVGDRVVVPFPIACGACVACRASSSPAARTRIPTPESPRRCSATRWPGSSATPTSPAASPAARRSTSGCLRRRRPAGDRVGPDRRAGAVPLRHPAHRLHGRRDVRHHPATSSPSGVRGRSASSRWTAPGSSAPRG